MRYREYMIRSYARLKPPRSQPDSDPSGLLLRADLLFDRHRPFDTSRVDRQVVPPRPFRCDVHRIAADPARVDGIDNLAAAVAAAKDHFHTSLAATRFVLGFPVHSKGARVAGEGFGLSVTASG